MKFQVWNTRYNRPATSVEIRMLADQHDQLFFSWGGKKKNDGIVEVTLDSGSEDEFELRNL